MLTVLLQRITEDIDVWEQVAGYKNLNNEINQRFSKDSQKDDLVLVTCLKVV